MDAPTAPRTIEVHDMQVRRIDPNTPDMDCPKPHDASQQRRRRIDGHYPNRESRGKSPDRERRRDRPEMGKVYFLPLIPPALDTKSGSPGAQAELIS
jgi:hypothetical protein